MWTAILEYQRSMRVGGMSRGTQCRTCNPEDWDTCEVQYLLGNALHALHYMSIICKAIVDLFLYVFHKNISKKLLSSFQRTINFLHHQYAELENIPFKYIAPSPPLESAAKEAEF